MFSRGRGAPRNASLRRLQFRRLHSPRPSPYRPTGAPAHHTGPGPAGRCRRRRRRGSAGAGGAGPRSSTRVAVAVSGWSSSPTRTMSWATIGRSSPGRASGDDAGAGQHRTGPVRGRGEGEVHRQRVPERRIGELEARIDVLQDLRPGIVGPRLRAAWPVDDVHADQFVEADRAAARRGVRHRDPRIGFELPQAHGVRAGRAAPLDWL